MSIGNDSLGLGVGGYIHSERVEYALTNDAAEVWHMTSYNDCCGGHIPSPLVFHIFPYACIVWRLDRQTIRLENVWRNLRCGGASSFETSVTSTSVNSCFRCTFCTMGNRTGEEWNKEKEKPSTKDNEWQIEHHVVEYMSNVYILFLYNMYKFKQLLFELKPIWYDRMTGKFVWYLFWSRPFKTDIIDIAGWTKLIIDVVWGDQ